MTIQEPPREDVSARPLWSVMIPTFNCAIYLREALVSVLRQDQGPDIMQIEVVDDCSDRDDPEAVVRELGSGRVEFHRQPRNVGHTVNFATCLQRARGRLIHQLHGDDRVQDGFYKAMQRAFEQNQDIGAAFCRHGFIDAEGKQFNVSDLERPESGVLDGWVEKIAVRQHIQTPSMVVRRDVYEKLGGFDARVGAMEDWEMWVRIAVNYPVWYEVNPLALYRVHGNSSTSRYVRTGENIRDARRAIEVMHSYLPLEVRDELRSKALEHWARCAINIYARDLIESGHTIPAVRQLMEGLRCNHSIKSIKDFLYMLKFMGVKQMDRYCKRRSSD